MSCETLNAVVAKDKPTVANKPVSTTTTAKSKQQRQVTLQPNLQQQVLLLQLYLQTLQLLV